MSISIHQDQILLNRRRWENKPLLRRIYREFYEIIAAHLSRTDGARIVEIGSGHGNIKEVIPDCLRTDLFANPWIDQVENAYRLSFESGTLSDLILLDVFHHFRYPGTALAEFARVLRPGGRVIIFDPCISLLGALVYGLFHPEPIALNKPIEWFAPASWSPLEMDYYAAQGNASSVFTGRRFAAALAGWRLQTVNRFSALAYVASGGYSRPQLYPEAAYGFVKAIERICDRAPALFATRLLVVLEKK